MVAPIIQGMARGDAPSFVPLNIDQYLELIRAGILREGAPIELIDGMLVYKDRGDARSTGPMVHGPDHVIAVKELLAAITVGLTGLPYHPQCQMPIAIPPDRMPEPDVSIVKGRPRDYGTSIPPASATLAAMEVAHSSRTFDRGEKLAIYAAANIPVYIVVDLVANVIEVYSQPVPDESRYDRFVAHARGESVSFDFAGHSISFAVDDVLP